MGKKTCIYEELLSSALVLKQQAGQ